MLSFIHKDKINKLLQETRKKTSAPGMFLSISNMEDTISFSSGSSKLVKYQPITLEHQFRIASVSKTLTSTAISRLVDQGKISFEDPITNLLDIKLRFSREIPKNKWKPPRIKHLLSHTSGLGEFMTTKDILSPRKMFSVWSGEPDKKPSELKFYQGKTFDLYNAPGEKWYYANHGFGLLGAVIEKVTKKRFRDAVKDLVLRPCGMSRTSFDFQSIQPPYTTGTYVVGKKSKKLREAPPIDIIDEAAGSAVSTPLDLIKFARQLIQTYHDEKEGSLLSKSTLKKMWTPYYSPDPEFTGMGLGFFVVNRDPLILEHGGTINGYNTLFIIIPEEKLTLLTYINRISPLFFKEATKLLRKVLALLGINWPYYSKLSLSEKSSTQNVLHQNYRAGPYTINRSRFISEFGNEIEIIKEENGLLLVRGRAGALKNPLWLKKTGEVTNKNKTTRYYLGFLDGKPVKLAVISNLSPDETLPPSMVLYESINTVKLYPGRKIRDRINEKITFMFVPLLQLLVKMVIK